MPMASSESRAFDPESASVRMGYAERTLVPRATPRSQDILIVFSRRPSNSVLETSLHRSATYEHELKDLEVHISIRYTSFIIDRSSPMSTGKAPRRSQ